MPKINEDVIRAVTDAAKIEDIVGDYVKLRKSGVNMTGCCPFHDDHNDGNFIVRPSTLTVGTTGRNTYKCFVCGAKGGPVQFLMESEKMSFPDAIRYIGKKYSIEVDNVPLNWTPPPPRPVPPPLPTLELPRDVVLDTMQAVESRDLFVNWLCHLPWHLSQREWLDRVLWLYCVGHWYDGRVVFWQIDEIGKVRSGKLMRYDLEGHRIKTENPGWMHKQQGVRERLDLEGHTFRSTLFGMHLTKKYTTATIHLVESEKTALICAVHYGDLEKNLWVACGGLKHLRLEALQPLFDTKRNIVLWPDKDGVKEWIEARDKMDYPNVIVNTSFLDKFWTEADGMKADIADIIVRIMREPVLQKSSGSQNPVGILPLSRGSQRGSEQAAVPTDQTTPNPSYSGGENEYTPGQVNVQYDGPFLDLEELRDPRILEWRLIMAASHRPDWERMRRVLPNQTTPNPSYSGGECLRAGDVIRKSPEFKHIIDHLDLTDKL